MDINLTKIVQYTSQVLNDNEMNDVSWNGLQIENSGRIDHIYAGVDATYDFFKSAPNPGHSLFLVHHGLYWRFSDPKTTGVLRKKLNFCFENDCALLAYHLPLDIHPVYGNNSRILQKLGVTNQISPFGYKDGFSYGLSGNLSQKVLVNDIFEKSQLLFSMDSSLFSFGPGTIESCAVISGSGGFGIQEAYEKKIDLFITGEYSHSAYTFAKDHEINLLCLTHYGSEKEGVIALGENIASKFLIDFSFIDILPVF